MPHPTIGALNEIGGRWNTMTASFIMKLSGGRVSLDCMATLGRVRGGTRDVVVGGMKSELVLTKQCPNLPYRQQIKTNQGD